MKNLFLKTISLCLLLFISVLASASPNLSFIASNKSIELIYIFVFY